MGEAEGGGEGEEGRGGRAGLGMGGGGLERSDLIEEGRWRVLLWGRRV